MCSRLVAYFLLCILGYVDLSLVVKDYGYCWISIQIARDFICNGRYFLILD